MTKIREPLFEFCMKARMDSREEYSSVSDEVQIEVRWADRLGNERRGKCTRQVAPTGHGSRREIDGSIQGV